MTQFEIAHFSDFILLSFYVELKLGTETILHKIQKPVFNADITFFLLILFYLNIYFQKQTALFIYQKAFIPAFNSINFNAK